MSFIQLLTSLTLSTNQNNTQCSLLELPVDSMFTPKPLDLSQGQWLVFKIFGSINKSLTFK